MTDMSIRAGGEALGITNINNWQLLSKHIYNYIYDSLVDIKNKNGMALMSIIYPKHKHIFKKYLNEYIFGLDFFDLPLNYIEIRTSLLGKSFFDSAILYYPFFDKNVVLENQFINTKFFYANIINTYFYNCDFHNALFGDNSIFNDVRFIHSLFNNSIFRSSIFYKSVFTRCQMSKTTLSGPLLIETEFKNCNLRKIKFVNCIIDEHSLTRLLSEESSLENDVDITFIGRLDESKFDFNSINIFTRKELSERSINTIIKLYNITSPSIVNFLF